ncbi:MAG: hypothetical protein WCX28_05350 [Bacteriovoracaceae bacterium]|nr:hypothetical protein [Bacteroidota bacterium]
MAQNNQHITIGLLRENFAWVTLLDQIGVSWKMIQSITTLVVSDYSVIICNRSVTTEEYLALQNFSIAGGIVLYTIAVASIIRERTVRKHNVASLPPNATDSYQYSEILDLYDTVHFFKNGTFFQTEQSGSGLSSYCGIDIENVFSLATPIRKSFYAPRKRMPHEIVAYRSRCAIRQIVQSHLEYLHHQRGLPFVHKWFYPSNHQTLFTFRIDSDKGTQSQIDEIFQLSEKYTIPTTWFLDVKSHEEWLQYFTKFDRQEIGVHCYEHVVHNSTILNRENFEKALFLLRQENVHPAGIAAPTGAWNTSIGTAIRELGFAYSSEFAYDYDNLPSFPVLDNTFSPVVQLPVHPTCVGTMRREHMTQDEMVYYFISIINQKIAQREPICLYHHPTHETNGVFEEVFRYINDKQILKLSYSEYAAWWKRRQHFSVLTQVDNSRIICETHNASDDTFIRIAYAGQRESIVQAQHVSGAEPNQLPQKSIPAPVDIMRSRQWKFRHSIQNALDWWIKTTE